MSSLQMPMGNAKQFDQFYTNPAVANECFNTVIEFFGTDIFLVEPSAGYGSFLFEGYDYYACDIEPKNDRIIQQDFLKEDISSCLPKDRTIITIGNPPFGHRSKLALEFLNKALSFSKAVCFILPIQFQKYLTQKNIVETAYLVYDKVLNPKSFIYEDKPYSVRCCFQIWENDSTRKDLRKRNNPKITHSDFILLQYNGSPESLDYFNKDKYQWDFAVPRQGFNDYTIKETNPDNMSRKKQWFFIKAKNKEVLNTLYDMDFEALSRKNTSTPGFGKADFIAEYEKMTGKTDSIERFY